MQNQVVNSSRCGYWFRAIFSLLSFSKWKCVCNVHFLGVDWCCILLLFYPCFQLNANFMHPICRKWAQDKWFDLIEDWLPVDVAVVLAHYPMHSYITDPIFRYAMQPHSTLDLDQVWLEWRILFDWLKPINRQMAPMPSTYYVQCSRIIWRCQLDPFHVLILHPTKNSNKS